MLSLAVCENGEALFTVVCGSAASLPEKTAALMLLEEIERKTGVRLPLEFDDELKPKELRGNLIILGTLRSNSLCRQHAKALKTLTGALGKESFAIEIVFDENAFKVFLVGADERGVLYAVDNLLDHLKEEGRAYIVEVDEGTYSSAFQIRAFRNSRGLELPDIIFSPSETLNALKRAVDAAARQRLNTLSVTVSWPADLTRLVLYERFPRLYDPSRTEEVGTNVKILKEMILHARDRGLDTYVTATEFTYPRRLVQAYPEILGELPSSRETGSTKKLLCPSNPLTWQFLEAKLGELVSKVPEVAGFDLWVSAAHTDILACQCSKCRDYAPHRRILDLLNKILEISGSDSLERRLFFRVPPSGYAHMLTDESLNLLANEMPKEVVIRHMEAPVDFLLGRFADPLIGKFWRNIEVVDFDAFGEYRGGSLGLPSCVPEHLHTLMRSALEKHIRGVGTSEAQGLNDVNRYAFARLAWDPDYPVEVIWREWATERFGNAAATEMIELAKLADEVILKAFYTNGVNTSTGFSIFPQSLEQWQHIMDLGKGSFKDGLTPVELAFENLDTIIAEKEDAVRTCEQMLSILEEARPKLQGAEYAPLKKTLELELAVVSAWRWLSEAYFRCRAFEAAGNEADREQMRGRILSAVETCRTQIEQLRRLVSPTKELAENNPASNVLVVCKQIIERTEYEAAHPFA